MKYCRIGYTEGSLLFIYWMKYLSKLELNDEEIFDLNLSEKNLLNWLHSTSGFYNKQMNAKYFDVDYNHYNYEILNKYLNIIYESLYEADTLWIQLHNFTPKIKTYLQLFIDSFNYKIYKPVTQHLVYSLIEQKNVLIISPFANLIKQQNDSGNVKKIYNNYPNITNIICYTSPYTFFNNGPDENILETCNKINEDITNIKEKFDIAIISVGAYSNLIALHINKNLNKDSITIGGELPGWFGILNNRAKSNLNKNNIILENKEYYITEIPDEYKPTDYMKIENGCYW